MVILKNIKNILNHSFCLLVLLFVFSLVATEVAEAKTINSSVSYADETRINYFNNLYLRSGYKNFLLSVENSSSGYTNYSYYFMCLTDEKINLIDELNARSNCEKMYTYYRNSNGDYVLEQYNDTSLEILNSVYYTNPVYDYNKIILCFVIGLFISINVYVLYRVYNDFYKR